MSDTRPVRDHTSLTAAEYDRSRKGHIEERRLELVERVVRTRSIKTLLDLGCGTGSFLARLAAAHSEIKCVGVELDDRLAEYARETYSSPNLEFLSADVASFQPTQHFDLAVSIDFLHHVPDMGVAAAAIRRALGTNASWLVMEPNVFHPQIWLHQESMKRAGVGEDHFRPWRFTALLQEAGFKLVSRRYILLFPGSVTPPRWLSRVERVLERAPMLGGSVVLECLAV